MKAARWYVPRTVMGDAVTEPELSNAHDVLVEVDVATICASDVPEWRDGHSDEATYRLTGQAAPITLGHEIRLPGSRNLPGRDRVLVGRPRLRRCPPSLWQLLVSARSVQHV